MCSSLRVAHRAAGYPRAHWSSSPICLRASWGQTTFAAFLDTIARGELDVEHLTSGDHAPAAELMRTYKDLRVGFVDCAVLAVVERLGETKLATLDHRHFATMRHSHASALVLLPA